MRTPHGRLKVIPDGWSRHHRPTAYGFLTGDSEAHRPGDPGDWSPGQPPLDPNGTLLWESMPCSVQILTNAARTVIVADGQEVIASHRLSVPIAATTLRYADVVTILDNPDDLALNGRTFQVLTVETGTTNWTRDYLVQDLNRQEADAA